MANKFIVAPAPHMHNPHSTQSLMRDVILALVPALLVSVVVYGLSVLYVTAIAVASCVVVEYLIQKYLVKGNPTIGNLSAVVTGLLLAFNLPASIPWWIIVIGSVVAIGVAKMTFGGLGHNPFNPALVGRVFLLIAYPVQMTSFPEIQPVIGGIADTFSGATPLTQLADGLAPAALQSTPMDWFIGTIPGCIGETSTVAILLGAALLLFTGVASWRIMLSVFAGGYLMGLLFNLIGVNAYMDIPAHYHLLIGGFAFGAVFMATDPVTASQTNAGKWIYGLLVGVLAVLIRVVNPGYPEGMMLSILFMNLVAPLIDYYVVEANIKRRLKRVKTVK